MYSKNYSLSDLRFFENNPPSPSIADRAPNTVEDVDSIPVFASLPFDTTGFSGVVVGTTGWPGVAVGTVGFPGVGTGTIGCSGVGVIGDNFL